MKGFPIPCHPSNPLLCIQDLKFTSAPWSNTPKKQFNNFKCAIFKVRQARHLLKHVKQAIFWSMPSTRTRQARKARKASEHLNTPFSRLLYLKEGSKSYVFSRTGLTDSRRRNIKKYLTVTDESSTNNDQKSYDY